jgi:2-polyprenyl-3-methyl-5-hydroxy-6-metoxy-1,4-benzoquinol methylase
LERESSRITVLTERQRIEAGVYDARVRESLAHLSDEELRVDPTVPPFPNVEHIDFLSFALSCLPVHPGAQVLEVGSGTGALSVYLAQQGPHVTGIDVSEENARLSARRAAANGVVDRTDFRAVPIEQLADPDSSFDFIIGNQVLHHFEMDQALANIRRLLRPGGRAVFCEPVLLLPDVLRRLRATPHMKKVFPLRVDTPTERSVSLGDLMLMRQYFPSVRVHHFQLLARIRNFVYFNDNLFIRLERFDRLLLRWVPPLRMVSRFAVFEILSNEKMEVSS